MLITTNKASVFLSTSFSQFLSESVEKQRSRLYGPVAILLVENEKETAVLR